MTTREVLNLITTATEELFRRTEDLDTPPENPQLDLFVQREEELGQQFYDRHNGSSNSNFLDSSIGIISSIGSAFEDTQVAQVTPSQKDEDEQKDQGTAEGSETSVALTEATLAALQDNLVAENQIAPTVKEGAEETGNAGAAENREVQNSNNQITSSAKQNHPRQSLGGGRRYTVPIRSTAQVLKDLETRKTQIGGEPLQKHNPFADNGRTPRGELTDLPLPSSYVSTPNPYAQFNAQTPAVTGKIGGGSDSSSNKTAKAAQQSDTATEHPAPRQTQTGGKQDRNRSPASVRLLRRSTADSNPYPESDKIFYTPPTDSSDAGRDYTLIGPNYRKKVLHKESDGRYVKCADLAVRPENDLCQIDYLHASSIRGSNILSSIRPGQDQSADLTGYDVRYSANAPGYALLEPENWIQPAKTRHSTSQGIVSLNAKRTDRVGLIGISQTRRRVCAIKQVHLIGDFATFIYNHYLKISTEQQFQKFFTSHKIVRIYATLRNHKICVFSGKHILTNYPLAGSPEDRLGENTWRRTQGRKSQELYGTGGPDCGCPGFPVCVLPEDDYVAQKIRSWGPPYIVTRSGPSHIAGDIGYDNEEEEPPLVRFSREKFPSPQ